MSAVSTHTAPPPADTVQPVAGAPTSAPVPPTGDNTTPNPNANQPAATLETQAGAGGGVDFEKMDANAYERYIESLPDDGQVIESEDLDKGSAVAAPAANPSAPTTEVKPGEIEHEEGILAPGKLPARMKIPTEDPLWFHVGRFHKEAWLQGRKLTPDEAVAMAKQYLGISTEPAAAVEGSTVEPGATAPVPTTTEAPVTGRLADLSQALDEAVQDFEKGADGFTPAQQAAALRKINDLNRQVTAAMIEESREKAVQVSNEAQQQAAEEAAFMQQWQATEAQVHGMFAHANAADPNSPLHQKAAEIQARYRDSQDPAMQAIYNSPTSVLLYFTQAAGELSIQPSAAPAAPVSPSSVKSTPPSVSRHVPVGAALLATQQGGTKPVAPGGFNLDAITTSHQLESLIERMAA